MDDEKTTKHSGYVYNRKTKEGFARMKRMGIPMPPFRIEDNVTRLLTTHYDRLIKKLADASKAALLLEKATSDSMYKRFTSDSVYSEIIAKLQDALIRAISSDKTKIAKQIRTQLNLARRKFFDELIDDASDKVAIRVQFALDKDEVFQQRIDGLQKHYLDSALDRITWEEDFLKSAFLMQLTDYSTGKSADLESLKDVIKGMQKTSVKEARFFARDQFAKFNKAMTVTSFEQAGVDKVKWMPVNDGRTRPTHTIDGIKKKYGTIIFDMNNLPEEKDDYNCFIPSTKVEGKFYSASKAVYSGPIWTINTLRGYSLTVTPNHPVLTSNGWIKACNLKEGMDAISYSSHVNKTPLLSDVHNQNIPPTIKDVFDSFWPRRAKMMGIGLDFYGDAAFFKSNIDIVGADRVLGKRGISSVNGVENRKLKIANKSATIFCNRMRSLKSRLGSFYSLFKGDISSGASLPSFGTLLSDCVRILFHDRPLQEFSFGPPANWDTHLGEPSKQDASIEASFIAKLLEAGCGLISFDKIINLTVSKYNGHVYDLHAQDGYIMSNGIVSSNCRCGLYPIFED